MVRLLYFSSVVIDTRMESMRCHEREKTTHHRLCCFTRSFPVFVGKTVDTNSAFLAKGLFDLGIELKRIEVIADDEDEVSLGFLSPLDRR